MVLWGRGGQKRVFGHFWREALKEIYLKTGIWVGKLGRLRTFGQKILVFRSMGSGGVFSSLTPRGEVWDTPYYPAPPRPSQSSLRLNQGLGINQ